MNDNEGGGSPHGSEPDPQGQAAMLLVESLIHGLIDRSILTVDAAIDIVEVAMAVKRERATELGDSPTTLQHSLSLLKSIDNSLRADRQG